MTQPPAPRAGGRVGVGLHRIRGDASEVVATALGLGCRLIDSAANYRAGRANKEVGEAVTRAVRHGVLADVEQIIVTTKVGYHRLGASHDTVITHSLDPSFVRAELQRAVHDLSPAKIECMYLHNPEEEARQPGFERRFSEALIVLEEARSAGAIRAYGVASWDGFDFAGREPAFTIRTLVELAEASIGTDHGLKYLQLPISLIRHHAALAALSDYGPIADAAARGLRVYGSSPLHGGQLPSLLTDAFVKLFPAARSPAQACIDFVLSVPGVSGVLTSPSTTEQLCDSVCGDSTRLLTNQELQRILDSLK